MKYEIRNIQLAGAGTGKIEWARQRMDVLGEVTRRFTEERPLAGIRVSASLHVTAETAVLVTALKAGGADVALCASNPLSTQDDVAAALVAEYSVPVYGIRGEEKETYYRHLLALLDRRPHIVMDDGADLVSTLHREREELTASVIGGTEETTTGVIRLRSMVDQGKLKFPVIAVNDACTKQLFDNRYGTGQSSLDGITRATNILFAGKTVVVAGYGWCGKGIASRAAGLGARVIVTEIDPVRAIEAVMEGFQVMPMDEAVGQADIIITISGNRHVVSAHHYNLMKNEVILCNAGHFNVEIDVEGLRNSAVIRRTVRQNMEEYTLKNRNRIYLLGEGRLVNLAAGEGHPAEVMDMSFAGQALSAEYLVTGKEARKPGVTAVPEHIDHRIALLKLKSMGFSIDALTLEQEEYRAGWESGT